MPDVDVMSDMDILFTQARLHTVADTADIPGRTGARHVVVVTPGRNFLSVPIPDPESVPCDPDKLVKEILHSNKPLNIVVVAYTQFEALVDKGGVWSGEKINRSIPFLGFLIAFAYTGHTVVVFEGHRSAFEAGVRNCDVLLIDSAMLPFLENNWATVAFSVMAEDAHIFIHDRESYSLMPVTKAKNEARWSYNEPDGEGSYANCLLTVMTSAPKMPVCIIAGSPLPDLSQINTDSSQLERISCLPFKYEQLDADRVMDILLRPAGRGLLGVFTKTRTLRGRLVTSSGERLDVLFELTESRSKNGKRQLLVERRATDSGAMNNDRRMVRILMWISLSLGFCIYVGSVFFDLSDAASDSQQSMWAHIIKIGGMLVMALYLKGLKNTYRN